MKVTKVNLEDTGTFSKTFLDYISGNDRLLPFYEFFPDWPGFENKIKNHRFTSEKREILQRSLRQQYEGFEIPEPTAKNLEALTNTNTFTVTTGHQLNICTGPLYFIYKIITVINLAKELKKKYPDYNFVPVYWMASEDHDFEEINHFYLFGKKIIWETNQKGAVGRFDPSGILDVLNHIPDDLALFKKAYSEQHTLSAATRFFINHLFGSQGLVVMDADARELKDQFKEVIKDELVNQTSARLVAETTKDLETLGYKPQVNPREINLFFLDHQIRERILIEDGQYKINNTGLHFSKEQILLLAENEPEKFSPNVLLRPLYEEMILPNLCYTGGPAEIVYWLQLKSLFSNYQIPFPILLPRNFVLYINKTMVKKMKKLAIREEDLFLKDEQLVSKFISSASGDQFLLDDEKNLAEQALEKIAIKAGQIDQSLVGYVMSEKQKVIKSIDEIEKRLKKAEQKKNAEDIVQLTSFKSKLFPDNSLQERKENFLNFSINDPAFIQNMMDHLHPLEFYFNVVSED